MRPHSAQNWNTQISMKKVLQILFNMVTHKVVRRSHHAMVEKEPEEYQPAEQIRYFKRSQLFMAKPAMIQNNVVTTTRKRSPFKDVQPAKPSIYDFDASIAEKRLRTLPSVSPSIDFWYLKNIS